MSAGTVISEISVGDYRAITAEFADISYRQLAPYAMLAAERTGSEIEFVKILLDGLVIGAAAVRIKRLPILPFGIAYILGGPLVRGAQSTGILENMDTVVSALVDRYVRGKHLVLRISNPPDGIDPAVDRSDILQNGKFRPAKGQYNTILLDLGRSEEEMRKGFHQKWRNCLNRAGKSDIEVVRGTDIKLFDQFEPLLDELKKKKEFHVDLGVDFFRNVQRNAEAREKLIVHLARCEGEIVAGHIGSVVGDTSVYLLGAANDAGNKLSASYLLQWNFMLESKRQGCRWYDLGGIDQDGNPGVYRFKSRMGGEEVNTKVWENGSDIGFWFLALAEKAYQVLKKR